MLSVRAFSWLAAGTSLLLLPFAINADPGKDDPRFARLVEAGKKQRSTDIEALKALIASANRQLEAIKAAKPSSTVRGQPYFSSKQGTLTFNYAFKADKDAAEKKTRDRVTELEAKSAELQKAEWVNPKLDAPNLEVGQIGVVTVNREKPVMYEAVQVIDGENVVIKFSGRLHWLVAPTKGMVDGRSYSLDQIVEVKGTKTYKTAIGGTKTVLELEAYTPPK